MSAATIDRYSALERVCKRMLVAARRDDWDEVRSIEGEVREHVAGLRAEPAAGLLDVDERREKFRILRNIVLIDAQLRHIAQPWQRHLDMLLAPSPAWQSGPVRPSVKPN